MNIYISSWSLFGLVWPNLYGFGTRGADVIRHQFHLLSSGTWSRTGDAVGICQKSEAGSDYSTDHRSQMEPNPGCWKDHLPSQSKHLLFCWRQASYSRPHFHSQMLAIVLPNIGMCSWGKAIAKWRLWVCLILCRWPVPLALSPMKAPPPPLTFTIVPLKFPHQLGNNQLLLFALQLFKNFTGITWDGCLQN